MSAPTAVQHCQVTQSELTSLTHLKAWGDAKRFWSNVAFLLILPKEGVAAERVYGLAMVWVHPYQARVSTINGAAKWLTQLASIGPNWPYALVWLNGETCHVPLPKEGHMSVMAEESTSHVPYRKICQLEVLQLLSSGSWVVYPEGLNGCQVPVIMTLPELLSNGMTMLEGGSTFLQVDLSQSTTREQESKALSLSSCLSPMPANSPKRAFPPKAEGQISMTMEVRKLLSQAVLDTSGLVTRNSTPKRPGSLALATLLPLKLEDSTKLVDTSSQVSTPDDVEMDDPTLEEIHASPSPPVKALGLSREAPSLDVTRLQEEANEALGHLLVTRSSIHAHWRKKVSDFGMALCQMESDVTEAIKEAKALCACTIRKVEAYWVALITKAEIQHATCIKEAEADCAHALAEVENCCSTTIREAESQGATEAHSIQQSHDKDIQCLEAEAIEEEKRECLAFLATSSATLRASPPQAWGIMVTPFHLLLRNAPMSTLLSIPPGASSFQQEPAPQTPLSSTLVGPRPSPQSKRWHDSPTRWSHHSHLRPPPKQLLKSLPIQSRRRKCYSIKPCQGVTRKLSAEIPNWWKGWRRNTTEKTACTLTVRLPATWQMFSTTW